MGLVGGTKKKTPANYQMLHARKTAVMNKENTTNVTQYLNETLGRPGFLLGRGVVSRQDTAMKTADLRPDYLDENKIRAAEAVNKLLGRT